MARLSKWGHSLGLRIPKHVATCAALKVGDELGVRLLDCGSLLVTPTKPRGVPDGYKVPDKEAVRQPTDEEILAQW
jgi:antitoxin component of MazEF toxin-antitoxin module